MGVVAKIIVDELLLQNFFPGGVMPPSTLQWPYLKACLLQSVSKLGGIPPRGNLTFPRG